MNKKLFLVAVASTSIAFCGLNTLSASAEEDPAAPSNENYSVMPIAEQNYDDQIELHDNDSDNVPCDTSLEDCPEPIAEDIEDGNPEESVVVCADSNEPDCVTTNETTIVKVTPELWPMILSLGALGLAAVVIIILNLTGPKKK